MEPLTQLDRFCDQDPEMTLRMKVNEDLAIRLEEMCLDGNLLEWPEGLDTVREAAEAARELERLKRTVEHMERTYLATHGGSWGECGYKADAARFAWWFGPTDKIEFVAKYIEGVSKGFTVEQWRAVIDAAMKEGKR